MFSQTDDSALTKKWADIEKKPVTLFKVALDRTINAFHRNEMVYSFLTYLKLFPVHKIGYDRAVNGLLVFSEVRQLFITFHILSLFTYFDYFRMPKLTHKR